MASKKKLERPGSVVRAHVVLRSASGKRLTQSSLPTAATIGSYVASKEVTSLALKALKKLGFSVVNSSPFQVTVEGSKERFEQVFKSRLKLQELSSPRHAKPVPTCAWTWQETPQVPEELEDAMEEIVLPQPLSHG